MNNLSLIFQIALISLVGAKLQNFRSFQESSEESEELSEEDDAILSVSGFRNSGSNQRGYAVESSSCNGLFKIVNQKGTRSGFFAIPNPKSGFNVIRLVLSYPANFVNNEQTEVFPAKDDASSMADIENGQPLLYRVEFPYRNVVPLATAIYYNGALLCVGPPAAAIIVTETIVSLGYTAVANQLGSTQPRTKPKPPRRTTTRRTTTRRASARRNKPVQRNSSAECGVPDLDSSGEIHAGFVVGGKEPALGQFPWLAAMKVKDQFYCGGSLINSKMVITAAHCIQTKSNVVRRRDITFVLGGHNLDEDERNSESSAVSTLIVHDDWMAGDDVDADIAIAVLTKTISYTKFIKPICLWTSTSSYDDVIGSKATIAGWGKTGKDLLSTDHPNYVVVPIVELEECKSSHDFFNEIASDRTFCAGDLKVNQSPCSGDSGGGLIVKSGRKWFLRGLVSHGIINSETQKCTPKNYVMFTDVAAFKDWIQEIVDDYL